MFLAFSAARNHQIISEKIRVRWSGENAKKKLKSWQKMLFFVQFGHFTMVNAYYRFFYSQKFRKETGILIGVKVTKVNIYAQLLFQTDQL